MDSITQQRVALVHPELIRRYQRLDALSSSQGVVLRVTRGLATWNEQAAIFAQGRQPLLTVNDMRKGVEWAPLNDQQNKDTVTDAAPGYSAHNFGYALDIVPADPDFPKFQPDYNAQDAQWKKILNLALSFGLAEGAQWTMKHRDYPHLYLQELPATPTDMMRQTFIESGLMSVWKEWPWPIPTST